MSRLRTNAVLKPYQFSDDKFFKVLFQNVRSLHLHVKNVDADYNIQAAHINIFVETALCLKDESNAFILKNFKLY